MIYSCQESEVVFTPDEERNEAIDKAKAFYDTTIEDVVKVYSGSYNEDCMKVMPQWDSTLVQETEEFLTVEMPMLSEFGFCYYLPGNEQKAEEMKDGRYETSGSRMVFLTDKTTNETLLFIMTIAPAVDYIEATNFNPYRSMTYLKRDNRFSGLIFFHNADGTLSNGWQYEKGEIISDMSFTGEAASDYVMTRSSSTIYYVITTCVSWVSTIEGMDGYAYYGSQCSSNFSSVTYTYGGIEGRPIDDNSNGRGIAGGYNGVGGSGSPLSINGVTGNVSLDSNGKNIFENTIRKIMEENCGMQYIKEYLSTTKGAVTFSDVIYSDGQPGYNTSTKVYQVRGNDYIKDSFMEEYIHLFQDNIYHGGINQYIGKDGNPNLEFEAMVLKDIMCEVREGVCGYINEGKYSKEYYYWINDIARKITNGQDLILDEILKGYNGISYMDFAEDYRVQIIKSNSKATDFKHNIIRELRPAVLEKTLPHILCR